MMLAAEAGNVSVCRELLLSFPEEQLFSRKRDTGDTILHIACRKREAEMVKAFVESGAQLDAQNVSCDIVYLFHQLISFVKYSLMVILLYIFRATKGMKPS